MTGRFLTRYSHSTTNPANRGFLVSGDRLMSFFHGVTMTAVDTGARTISLPTSSIIGLVDTFTEAPANSAKVNDLVLITSEREAIAAFGLDSAITKACQAV
ncbi:Major tail sheath protein, partial [Pseudomonas syringae]